MMYFEKKRGNNKYHVLACNNNYDFDKQPWEQEEKYDVRERNKDFFDLMMDYYQNNAKENAKMTRWTGSYKRVQTLCQLSWVRVLSLRTYGV